MPRLPRLLLFAGPQGGQLAILPLAPRKCLVTSKGSLVPMQYSHATSSRAENSGTVLDAGTARHTKFTGVQTPTLRHCLNQGMFDAVVI